ncbi:MAG: CopG family transcriptional regulator [Elusimicrobia bacterium]|nr:CopG family transcriptional regulator [Elusimicrobiota bacterium]
MQRHTAQWTVSLPPPLCRQALRIAKEESRTRSELVREALRVYIARKEGFVELRRKLAENLESRGIRSLEDVERMIDEGRT